MYAVSGYHMLTSDSLPRSTALLWLACHVQYECSTTVTI